MSIAEMNGHSIEMILYESCFNEIHLKNLLYMLTYCQY